MPRGKAAPKKRRCYIYTRVSTQMQVEGFSLDAQRNRLLKEAEHRGMEVAGEFSDEGKSGKNVTGRPQFLEMVRRIQDGNKDGVSYVYVFKLSRFGRNAADVLNFMQLLRDYDVNLLCAEDGLDSSTATGRIMVTILAAVAEMERENIHEQTIAGRQQKAREGLWNGSQAPFGYQLDGTGADSRLAVDEDEAPIVRLIFDKFVHTGMGYSGVAKWLNRNNYTRKVRGNGKYETFTDFFIKKLLDNPVYAGKIAYGRTEQKKIEGTRDEYRRVAKADFDVYEGRHEAIIPEQLWEEAQAKRKKAAGKALEHYGSKNIHVLSGIVRCPGCGSPMYGMLNKKKKKDGSGEFYSQIPYYYCKNTKIATGKKCDYRHSIRQEILDAQVYEVVLQAIGNTNFIGDMAAALGKPDDLEKLSAELEALRKTRKTEEKKKARLLDKIAALDVDDDQYDAMYDDLQSILHRHNQTVSELDDRIEDAADRLRCAREDSLSADQLIAVCRAFMSRLGEYSSEETRALMRMFLESVTVYPEPLPSGQIVRGIKFKFPVTLDGTTVSDVFDYDEDNEEDGGEPPDDDGPPLGGDDPPKPGDSPSGSGISCPEDSTSNPNTLPAAVVIRNSAPLRG